MQNERPTSTTPAGGFNAQDILLIVFKHKWMILILTVLGLGAAAFLYKQQPALYASKAKIFIRYLVEREIVDNVDSQRGSGGRNAGEVMSAEIELITSRNIALAVAKRVGVEEFALEGNPKDPLETAAAHVSRGLQVAPLPAGNVLEVSFQNENPEIVQDILTVIIEEYKAKHFAVHRESGSLDFVTKQVAQVRMRMDDTERALDELRKKAGVISLPERRAALDKALVAMEQQVLEAEGELAVQKAVVSAARKKIEAFAQPGVKVKVPGPATIRAYRLLLQRLNALLNMEADLALRFVANNPNLIRVRQDIAAKNAEINQMEQQYPGLVQAVGPEKGPQVDPLELERQEAILEVIQGKVDRLNKGIADYKAEGEKLSEYGPQIAELERRFEVDEKNWMYYQNALEKARVDGALDPSRAPNLEVIEDPTPPKHKIDEKMQKIILAVAGSGLGIGLGLAFFIEMFLKRGIRKPLDLETELQIPLLLAIPNIPKLKGSTPLLELASGEDGPPALMMSGETEGIHLSQPHQFIQPYTEAIRDRLVFHFELHEMTHKPKLVAFTGLSEGAGSSTLAAGLAHAFADEDGAKVLLVDMNSSSDEEDIYDGIKSYSLSRALGLPDGIRGDEEILGDPTPEGNLVVASARTGRARDGEFAPRSLYELMPNMRTSDYDYIIFDMPPVGLMSPTLAMAGLMDKVLLVLDSSKTDRDVLRRRYAELASGKAHVSCIYNKVKRHAPRWVQGEI